MYKQNSDTIGGGVFLIGLGVLFLFDWFWPGILALIGIVAFVNQWLKGNLTGGLTSLILFGGLALVFSVGIDWGIIVPIALIGFGLLALVNALRGR